MDARRYVFFALLAFIGALGAGLVVLELAGVYTLALLRDVSATAELAPWTGFFSTLGLLLWAAAAGACLLTGAVLLRAGEPAAWFFLATAGLVAFLAFDDAYLFHEEIAPERLGISERGVYALILVMALVWAARFRLEIARSDRWLFAVAMVSFGGSLAVDFASNGVLVVEDWFKLSGIVALAVWCFAEAFDALSSVASGRFGQPAGLAAVPSDHVPLPAHRPARGERSHVHERRPA